MMRRRLAIAPAGELAIQEPDCAREPIHIPGAIQPHGALLAVLASGLITHASANLLDMLGHDARSVLGRPLTDIMNADAAGILMMALFQPPAIAIIHLLSNPDGQLLELRAHQAGNRVIIDIEPVNGGRNRVSALLHVQSIRESLNGAANCVELCALAVRAMKQMTGYERVVAYRFGPDGNGEVVAEAVEPGLPPYLGMHYPAGDIPAQARRLFLRQRVGAIADSSYVPVEILAGALLDDTTPLDLTHSGLRSVSSVHREYMRNMNTAASLTVSLVQEAALWGMLVCHHGSPRVPGPELRAIAASIGHIVSSSLVDLSGVELAAGLAAKAATLESLRLRLGAQIPLADILAGAEDELLGLVDAAGAVIRCGGHAISLGSTPSLDAAERALGVLQPKARSNLFAVDDLGLSFPDLAACTMRGSGALLLSLPNAREDAILWFRPEFPRTVLWGGNPNLHGNTPFAGETLTPRKSFASWKEIVGGRSKPWSEADLQLARELYAMIDRETGQHALAEQPRPLVETAADDALAARDPALPGRLPALDAGLHPLLFDAAPDAMVVVDGAGEIQLVNLQAEKEFGYYNNELIGQPVHVLIPERFRSEHSLHWQEHAADPSIGMSFGRIEPYGRRKDGSEFPIEIALSDFATAEGLLVTAAIRNISVRKNAETQIARIGRQNRDLLEAAPDVMVMFKPGGEIVLQNLQADAQFGYRRHELMGRSIETIVPDGILAQSDSLAAQLKFSATGTLVSKPFELEGVRKDQTRFPIEITLGLAASGEGMLITAAIRDITTRKALETKARLNIDELQRSNEELARFATVASHDLQEPLRMVISYTQLLSRRYKGKLDADADDFIEFAVQGALRMQQLIRDLLDYCRLGAKDVELAETASDSALQNALKNLQPAIESSGAVITAGPLPRVMANAVQLARVFQNLIANAIIYRNAGVPVVDIRAEPTDDGKWLFSVRDNGLGIEPQYFERIFGMYQRLHSRDEFSGTGIGLAICKKIVEDHQGKISVQSRLGEGSVFQFTLLAGVTSP